jgi:hypothetical protein
LLCSAASARTISTPRKEGTMRRRRPFRTAACLSLIAAPCILGLAAALLRTPTTYQAIDLPGGTQRRQLSGEFGSKMQRLLDTVNTGENERWSESFTADQMNCYFAEDFERVRPFKLPPGVRAPRITIKPNRLTLAFRYGNERWNSVVTIDLRFWLVAHEANLVGVELLGLHAGAVPISPQPFLEQIAERARAWNVDLSWYRHEGKLVGLARIQPDRPNPSVVLQRLELHEGRLLVEGRSAEPAAFRNMLSLREDDQP